MSTAPPFFSRLGMAVSDARFDQRDQRALIERLRLVRANRRAKLNVN